MPVVVEVRDRKVVVRGGDVVVPELVLIVGVVVEAVLLVAGQIACAVSVPDPPTVAVVLILVDEARETPPNWSRKKTTRPGSG